MFTILLLEKRKGGVGGWLKGRRPKLEECRTLEVPWRLIRAPCGAKGPNWRGIERLAGRHRTKLITATATEPPRNSSVQVVRLYGLERIMAAKALCRTIKGEKPPQTVGVIDPMGQCLSTVEILLECAGCVMVYTHRPQRYEWFARQMLEQKGAPVVLCQNPGMMSSCRLVLLGGECPDWQRWAPRGSVVFSSVGQPSHWGGKLLHSFDPGYSTELLSQISTGVPTEVVCAALYELAARRELALLEPEHCVWQGHRTTMGQLEKICFL